MRDRRARSAVVGLVLLFPVLIAAATPAPRAAAARPTALTVLGVEVVLVGGFCTALRERRRLLAERVAPRQASAGRAPSLPHVRTARPATVRSAAR